MSQQNTILIVDDDEINRAILEEIFSPDYAIAQAADGREGLAAIRAGEDSLCAVLLDVVMPELSGIQVLRELKESGLTARLPVFLITAEASGSVMREAYQLGVMDVISKPVLPFVVRRRVESVIELFQARRRLGEKVESQQADLLRQAQRIIRLSQGMVEALSTAIEFRSDESGEHVRRIHDITCYMLRNTPLGEGFSEEEINLIGVGAITHDVGKISIPDAILNKRGRLTPEEYDIMKTHTVKGAELLSRIPQMKEHSAYRYAYDIALHHHERWDGRGYPDGLKGDEIPLWTQIVALADVYDALVSPRCYKKELPPDQALKMILDGQCGAFNPRLLEQFQQAAPVLQRLYAPSR